jgi:hypothetical protein
VEAEVRADFVWDSVSSPCAGVVEMKWTVGAEPEADS